VIRNAHPVVRIRGAHVGQGLGRGIQGARRDVNRKGTLSAGDVARHSENLLDLPVVSMTGAGRRTSGLLEGSPTAPAAKPSRRRSLSPSVSQLLNAVRRHLFLLEVAAPIAAMPKKRTTCISTVVSAVAAREGLGTSIQATDRPQSIAASSVF